MKGFFMSKTSSSSSSPSIAGNNISVNGFPTISSNFANGTLNSSYNMNDAQKAIYDYSQNTLANILPQLNTFSPEVQNTMNSELTAYVRNGVNDINSIYTPMISSLENDVASRFGNLDNSVFLDKLSGIENKRADAINSFAQDILSKQTSLQNQKLAQQYDYVNLLNNLQNQGYANALSSLNLSMNGNSNANNLYNTLYKQSVANSSLMNNLSDAIGGIF